jgi:hypothetical protein
MRQAPGLPGAGTRQRHRVAAHGDGAHHRRQSGHPLLSTQDSTPPAAPATERRNPSPTGRSAPACQASVALVASASPLGLQCEAAQAKLRPIAPNDRDRIELILPVEAAYPTISASWGDFERVVARLSRTDTLLHAARLGAIVSQATHEGVPQQQRRALQFLAPSAGAIDGGRTFEASSHESVRPVFRGQLLELIRWVSLLAADAPDDGTTFESQDQRDLLFAALLIAGDVWCKHAFAGIDSATGDSDAALAARLQFLHRNHSLHQLAPPLNVTLGRGWRIVGTHLRDVCPDFDSWFAEATGRSLHEHFVITTAMYGHCLGAVQPQREGAPTPTGLFDLASVARNCSNPNALHAFLRQHTIAVDDLAAALWPAGVEPAEAFERPPAPDWSRLRQRPFVRSRNDVCAVLDPPMLADFLLMGSVFLLNEPHRGRALSALGTAVERYMHAVLNRSAHADLGLARSTICSVPLGGPRALKAEIDAAVVDGPRTILLECKNVFVRQSAWDAGSSSEFMTILRNRLAGDKKGTGQLARSIRYLAGRPRAEWPEPLRQTEVIYPALVVSGFPFDRAIECWLAQDLRRRLQLADHPWAPFPIMANAEDPMRIAPLVVISLEALEFLEALAPRHHIAWAIHEFACKPPEHRPEFEQFLLAHPDFSGLRASNSGLLESADELLRAAKRGFFGVNGQLGRAQGGASPQ